MEEDKDAQRIYIGIAWLDEVHGIGLAAST
jgi:hypothetical protein